MLHVLPWGLSQEAFTTPAGSLRKGMNPGELPPWGESRPSGVGLAPSMEVISPHGPALKLVPHSHPVSCLREGLLSSWVGDLESWRPPGDSTVWEALHSMSLGRGSRLLIQGCLGMPSAARRTPGCVLFNLHRTPLYETGMFTALFGFLLFLTSASTLVCSTAIYPPHSF